MDPKLYIAWSMSRSEIGLVVPNEGLDAASSVESGRQALWFRVRVFFLRVLGSDAVNLDPPSSLYYILNYLFQKPFAPI